MFLMSRTKAHWRRLSVWVEGGKKAGEGWAYLQSWDNPPATIGTMAGMTARSHRPRNLHGVLAPDVDGYRGRSHLIGILPNLLECLEVQRTVERRLSHWTIFVLYCWGPPGKTKANAREPTKAFP
jgi:hypothetical protein